MPELPTVRPDRPQRLPRVPGECGLLVGRTVTTETATGVVLALTVILLTPLLWALIPSPITLLASVGLAVHIVCAIGLHLWGQRYLEPDAPPPPQLPRAVAVPHPHESGEPRSR